MCILGALGPAGAEAQKTAPRPARDSVHVLEQVRITAAIPQNDHEISQKLRVASRDSLLWELRTARQHWAAQHAPRIAYRVRRACGCIMSVTESSDITVEAVGDSILTLTDRRDIPTDFRLPNRHTPTVAALLDLAEEAIRGNADQITVAFDPVLGIPTRVYVDQRVTVTDDEEDIIVADITVIAWTSRPGRLTL